MKKLLIAFVLLAGLTAVAFASFNNRKKATTENKTEKSKKECSRKCLFS